jgi:hypothetical protein
MGKWIVAVCLAELFGVFGAARAADADIEYLLMVEPGVVGVSVFALDTQTGKKTQLVRGAQSIDEAIRQAMLRTGKPLILKFGTP